MTDLYPKKLPRGLGARARQESADEVQDQTYSFRKTSPTQEEAAKVVELIEKGHTFDEIAEMTGIPSDIIDARHGEWMAAASSERFRSAASKALTPSERLAAVMPQAAKLLEERNVEGFFETVAPIAAMQLARDAVTSPDEKIRHSAQKDILDRAGFKPKTQMEVYTKYDRMTREEIIASMRGGLMTNAAFAIALMGMREDLSKGKLLSPIDASQVIDVTTQLEGSMTSGAPIMDPSGTSSTLDDVMSDDEWDAL